MELTNTTTTILQYSDTVEGSLLTISCLEGYYLPGGDMMSVCTNGSWSPNPLNTVCAPEGRTCIHSKCVFPAMLCVILGTTLDMDLTTTVTVGIVCSIVFLAVGVVVGVVSVHIKNGLKKKLPTSPSPPPLPPPATYEEVGVASEKSHDIQLTSNESYAVNILQKDIPTSHNSAYGVV